MDYVAQFLANGGKVKQIASGTRAIESDKRIYAAMRNGTKAESDDSRITRQAESRAELRRELFLQARFNGASIEQAHRDAESV